MKPTNSEEQIAEIGNIKLKPMQRDLFTGELVTGRIKRGRGDHIKLTSFPNEMPYVPGMASWSNTGPEGVYCKDCLYYGTVGLKSATSTKIEEEPGVCALYVKSMSGFLSPKKNISVCGSCNRYDKPHGSHDRKWVIESNGQMNEVGKEDGGDKVEG